MNDLLNYIKSELNKFMEKAAEKINDDEEWPTYVTEWDKGRAAGLLEIKKMLDK